MQTTVLRFCDNSKVRTLIIVFIAINMVYLKTCIDFATNFFLCNPSVSKNPFSSFRFLELFVTTTVDSGLK